MSSVGFFFADQNSPFLVTAVVTLVIAGIEILSHRKEASQPGWSIHEVCTARMGSDPKTAILDGYNRSFDVPNLFVVDGAAFSSATALEPTLTIMALAARAGDHIADLLDRREMRKRGPREKLV